MKKFLLKLTAGALAALLITGNALGVTQVFNIAAGTAWNPTNLVNGPINIKAVTIATGSAGATDLTYALLDCPTVPQTDKGWYYLGLSNGAYASVGSYLTNILYIQTNFGGVYTNANGTTNWVTVSNLVYTYTNTVGATTNAWRVIAAGSVASNSGSSTLTLPSTGIGAVRGLGITNNNIGVAITVTLTYDTL